MRYSFLCVAMVFAMFFWGGSWASSKVLVGYAPSHIIAFWRFFFVLVICFALMLILRKSFAFDKNSFKLVVLCGILNSLYSLLFFAGLNYGQAGRGGVLVTTATPLFAYLLMYSFLAYKVYKNKSPLAKIPKNESIGLILGVISGLCLLELGSFGELFGKFNAFFLLASFDWAVMSFVTQRLRMHPLVINFYITLISVLCFTPLFFSADTYFIFEADGFFWANLCFIALFSTVIGTGIYYLGIQYLGAIKANTFLLLVPATSLLTSYLLLGEIPSLLTLFGATLAVVAIYLINIYGKMRRSGIKGET